MSCSSGSRPGQVLVHWLFHPDSYDDYLPAADLVLGEQQQDLEALQMDGSREVGRQAGQQEARGWASDKADGGLACCVAGGEQPSPPFTVACRFIVDVDRFNEWGNELDYDATRSSKGATKRPGGGMAGQLVRVRAAATQLASKKQPKDASGSGIK